MTQGYIIKFRGDNIPAEPIDLLGKIEMCIKKMYGDDLDSDILTVEKVY